MYRGRTARPYGSVAGTPEPAGSTLGDGEAEGLRTLGRGARSTRALPEAAPAAYGRKTTRTQPFFRCLNMS